MLLQVFDATGMVDCILFQQLCHQVLAFLQDGKDEVNGVNLSRFQPSALEEAQPQNLLRLAQHRYLAVGSIAQVAVHLADGVLYTGLDGGDVSPQVAQHGHPRAVGLADDAQKDMLHSDGAVLQSDGLVAAIGQGYFRVFC